MNSEIFFSCFPTLIEFTEYNKAVNINKGLSFKLDEGVIFWSLDHNTYPNKYLFPDKDRKYMIETYSTFFYERMKCLNNSQNKNQVTKLMTFNDLVNAAYHFFCEDTMRWFNCRVSENNIRHIPKLGITLVILSNKQFSMAGKQYDREYKIIAVDNSYTVNDGKKDHRIYDIQSHDTGLSYKQTKRRFEKLVQNANQGIIPQICD